ARLLDRKGSTMLRVRTLPITLFFAVAIFQFSAVPVSAGDFGRPKPSVLHGTILPFIGNNFARFRREPVSAFQLTDSEIEFRARAYALFMPVHRIGFFSLHHAELTRTRIWPDEHYLIDPSAYFRTLRAEGFYSSETRYRALETSVRADLGLIDPFLAIAERVYADDRRRLQALSAASLTSERENREAAARIYENRRVVDWAVTAMQWRVESYSFALERTEIEIPSLRANDVGHAIARLAAAVDIMAATVTAWEQPRFRRPYARHFERDPSYDPRAFPHQHQPDPELPLGPLPDPPSVYYK
ncbi:MAG: hypothetical protein AAGD23_11930, partial [Pseudomonadota bacterium]